jgi:hypothetical protein
MSNDSNHLLASLFLSWGCIALNTFAICLEYKKRLFEVDGNFVNHPLTLPCSWGIFFCGDCVICKLEKFSKKNSCTCFLSREDVKVAGRYEPSTPSSCFTLVVSVDFGSEGLRPLLLHYQLALEIFTLHISTVFQQWSTSGAY